MAANFYRYIVALPLMAVLFGIKATDRVKSFLLKLDIEDILHDQNDINESTRAQLEAISTALAELQAEHRQQPKRKPIGFIQPKEDENDESK
jgi:hypothetical protein